MAEKSLDTYWWDLPGLCPLGCQKKVSTRKCHSSEFTMNSSEEAIHKGVILLVAFLPFFPEECYQQDVWGRCTREDVWGKLLGTGHHRSSRSHFFRSQALEKKVLFGNPAQQKPLLSRPESWRKHVPQEPGKMRPPGIRKRKPFLSPVSLQCPLQTRLSIVLLAKAEHRATGKGKTLSKTHLHYHRAGKYG